MIACPKKLPSGRYADGMMRDHPTEYVKGCEHSYEDSEWSDVEVGDGDRTKLGRNDDVGSSTEQLNAMWLIFTCGSKTYTPHQVGFKRIEASNFTSKEQNLLERPDDKIDHVIEMHGHIIGMSLSPDHRLAV